VPPAPSLLLAAFAPELAGLDREPPAGWVCGLTGIGAVPAAVAAARLVALHRPARVLFLGTCGAYDARLSVGDLISASEAVATSADELAGASYRPGAERTRWAAGWPLPLPAHVVAVPPAITRGAEAAARLATLAAAEHLELTGVLAACEAAGVPAAAALAVANRAGPDAHAEWRASHERVSRSLIAALRERGVL
jgi:purine-nucleoside phosphorylase